MQKKCIYAEAANGITVRIPEESYGTWKKAQDEIRAGTRQADLQTAKQLRSLLEKR